MLTPEQLRRIREIVSRYHLATVADVAGIEALTPEEVKQLEEAGLMPETPKPSAMPPPVRAAFRFGATLARAAGKAAARLVGDKLAMAITSAPLTRVEELAAAAASERAGQWIRTHSAKVASAVQVAVTTPRLEDVIQEQVKEAVRTRKTIKQLKSDLGHMTKEWARDLDRIAGTELHNAHQQGLSAAYKTDHGDPMVFKRVLPGACKVCRRLLEDSGGMPKLFRLSELEANGSNIGRKQVDWLPVIDGIHPNCRCVMVRMPDGWGFNESGDMVPGGKRESGEAEPVQKSLKAETFMTDVLGHEARANFGIGDHLAVAKQFKRGPRLVITRPAEEFSGGKPLSHRVVKKVDKNVVPPRHRHVGHTFRDAASFIQRAEARKKRAKEVKETLTTQYQERVKAKNEVFGAADAGRIVPDR